jgi:hypothetical protein
MTIAIAVSGMVYHGIYHGNASKTHTQCQAHSLHFMNSGREGMSGS